MTDAQIPVLPLHADPNVIYPDADPYIELIEISAIYIHVLVRCAEVDKCVVFNSK